METFGFLEDNELPHWILPIKKLIHTKATFKWCQLEYPNHKKGCPNYCKAKKCPPFTPYVTDAFDMDRPLYFVFSEFDLSAHVERMRVAHPEWTERQLRNVLYWQPKSRKQMLERATQAMRILKTNKMTTIPEGLGVNVYATAAISGLHLDKIETLKICRHIAMIGFYPKTKEETDYIN